MSTFSDFPTPVRSARRDRLRRAAASLALAGLSMTAGAQDLQKAQEPAPVSPASVATTDRFDGDWTIHLACPSNTESSGARGYAYDFPASVLNGRLFGSRGAQGSDGSLQVEGTIAPDGSATLQAHGVTGDPAYTVKRAPSGTAYSYDVQAHFEAAQGSGRRVQDRVCDYTFTRR